MRAGVLFGALVALAAVARGAPEFSPGAFTEEYCASCHDHAEKKGGLDLTGLAFAPDDRDNFARWVQVHDRLLAGEMPPKNRKHRPPVDEVEAFLKNLSASLIAVEHAADARDGRATQRRLNGYEYENALRDLFSAPWLEIRGLFPDDGEAWRMLDDVKARRFTEAFLDYWIDLRKMEDSTPSSTLYHDYYLDDTLAEAALAEARLFFDDLVRRDRPVQDIVASADTFLNARLAQHYGVPGVEGIAMRRVALPPDSTRGEFMTMAAVLKVTANGTTTSPVLRGKNGQVFAFHLGLPVDAAGRLPDGRAFRDIRAFKRLLLDDETRLARNLAKQLVVYATGAPVRFSDRAALEHIVSNARSRNYGVRTLVHEIVQSDLFRNK